MKISLCMIVKDEESVLERCLLSAKDLADEIVIVDTGSSDQTVELAKKFTDNLYHFPWTDNFAEARNFAFSKATGDYLLWLDADDVLPAHKKETEKLLTLLKTERPDIVMCPYFTGFDGKDFRIKFQRERFLKREAEPHWIGRVHECIPLKGKVLSFHFPVLHAGSNKQKEGRNLRIYQKWAREEPLKGRDLFYYGRELFYNQLYTEAAAILNQFLENEGWYVNKIDACRVLCQTYYYANDKKMAYIALLRSFLYGEPRAYVLCELGKLFYEDGRLREAAYWYEQALLCRDHSEEGDFEEPQCRGIIPLLELVRIYYALGDRERAREYHKRTEALAPEHASVLYNRKFFPD